MYPGRNDLEHPRYNHDVISTHYLTASANGRGEKREPKGAVRRTRLVRLIEHIHDGTPVSLSGTESNLRTLLMGHHKLVRQLIFDVFICIPHEHILLP